MKLRKQRGNPYCVNMWRLKQVWRISTPWMSWIGVDSRLPFYAIQMNWTWWQVVVESHQRCKTAKQRIFIVVNSRIFVQPSHERRALCKRHESHVTYVVWIRLHKLQRHLGCRLRPVYKGYEVGRRERPIITTASAVHHHCQIWPFGIRRRGKYI